MTRDEAIELVMERWGIPGHMELQTFWGHVNAVLADPTEAERLRPVRGLRQKVLDPRPGQ